MMDDRLKFAVIPGLDPVSGIRYPESRSVVERDARRHSGLDPESIVIGVSIFEGAKFLMDSGSEAGMTLVLISRGWRL